MSLKHVSLLALVAGAASLCVPTAVAQQDAADETEARFGKVTVTAQRREENIQDVPLAISAFSAEDLEIIQVNDAIDLVDTIPNLAGGNNTSLGTANMYYLRGQGQDESFATFDPAVGTYVDEVFVARQNSNNFNLFDVERLEVLRGPQGTLFGKNTSGGAVNIVMRKPGEELGGYVEGAIGRFDRTMVRGSIDVPISDNIRTKFSAFTIQDDGWLENTRLNETYNDKQASGFRAAAEIDFSDAVTWSVAADFVDDKQDNITGELIGDDVVSTSILSGGLAVVFPSQAVNQKAAPGNQTEAFNVSSNLEWQTEAGTLNFILGNRSLDQEFLVNFPLPVFGGFFPSSPDDVFLIDNVGEHDQFSAELKWTGEYFEDRLKLVSGLYYLDEENTTDVASYFAFFIPSRDRVIENTSTNQAIYAQADWAFTDKLTATAGIRFTNEEKNFSVTDNIPQAGGAGGPTGDQTDLTDANLDALGIPRTIEEDVVTPRFALQYDFNDDLMAYASATRGFRTGGWNARSNTPAALTPFESEFVWSYELGTRADINEYLTVNATLFSLEVEDLQITTAIQTPGGTVFSIDNAGQMKNEGLELELYARPNDNLNLFAFLGLQNAEYIPTASELSACSVPNASFAAFDADCNPAGVKRAPDWTLNVGGSYDFDLPNGGTLQSRASLRAVADHYTATISRGASGDYTLYNFGVEYTSPDNAWSATIECTNCGDERYVTASFGAGDSYYNAPGRWEARLNYRFGASR